MNIEKIKNSIVKVEDIFLNVDNGKYSFAVINTSQDKLYFLSSGKVVSGIGHYDEPDFSNTKNKTIAIRLSSVCSRHLKDFYGYRWGYNNWGEGYGMSPSAHKKLSNVFNPTFLNLFETNILTISVQYLIKLEKILEKKHKADIIQKEKTKQEEEDYKDLMKF